MDPLWIGILSVVLLLFLLLINVPIAFALGLSGIAGIIAMRSLEVAFAFLTSSPYSTTSNWSLIVIPLFVFMGYLCYYSGISSKGYKLGHAFLGHIHGGLAMATVTACAAFAATSGSSVATAAAMSKISIPEMRKHGYSDKLSAGCVAACGTLGVLIPPSNVLVIYGVLTEQSISKLLISGFLPGIFTAIVYMLGIYILARSSTWAGPIGKRVSWKERVFAIKDCSGLAILFTIVMGGIYSGVFTAIEAAAVGAGIAFLLFFFASEENRLANIKSSLRAASESTCMIIAILVGASIFALNLTLAHIPQLLSQYLINLNLPPKYLIGIILLPYIPLGMFLDPISIMVLTLPIIYPVVKVLGFSGIWFGILVTKLIEISLITPPVGINLYVVKGIFPDIPLSTIIYGTMPFLVVEFVVLVVLFLLPEISLFLPSMMR